MIRIFLITLFAVSCSPAYSVDVLTTENQTIRCDSDCCDTDCPPLRYKCKAYLYVADKECGLTSDDSAIAFCQKVADFWFLPFDLTLCQIFPDPDNENLLCAEYKDSLTTIVSSTKKGVFTKAYEAVESFTYHGKETKVCMKFDPYCFAY